MDIHKNVGSCDAILRITFGLIILSTITLAHIGPKSCWAYLGLLGLIPLFTGLTGVCLPYNLLGINTREDKEEQK